MSDIEDLVPPPCALAARSVLALTDPPSDPASSALLVVVPAEDDAPVEVVGSDDDEDQLSQSSALTADEIAVFGHPVPELPAPPPAPVTPRGTAGRGRALSSRGSAVRGSTARTPRGRTPAAAAALPPPTPEDTEDAEDDEAASFECVVFLPKPPDKTPRPAAGRGRPKLVKPEWQKVGPILMPLGLSWASFLDKIAGPDGLNTLVKRLVVSSFQWKFAVPKTGEPIPVTSEAGLKSLLRQATSRAPAKRLMHLYMAKLRPLEPSAEPWNEPNTSGRVASSGEPSGAPGPDEYEPASDGEEDIMALGPIQSKGALGDEMEAAIARLDELYPVGNHPDWPSIATYTYTPTNLVFDMSFRPRKIIWAKKILFPGEKPYKGGYTIPPIGDPLWSTGTALKRKERAAATPVAPAAAPAPAAAAGWGPPPGLPAGHHYLPYPPPGPPYPPHYPPPPGYPMPGYGYPPMMPYPPPSPGSMQAGPSRARDFDGRSSPIPSGDEELEPMVLEEFCRLYRLSDVIRVGLEKLQFTPGVDLSELTDQDFEKAGLAKLSQKRVRDANKTYRTQLREAGKARAS